MKRSPDTPVCGAKKRQSDGVCQNVAGFKTDHVGEGRCSLHGGNTTNHRVRAARSAGERLATALAIEPHDALLANLAAWNGVVAYFTAEVSQLEETIVRYRREKSVRVGDPAGDQADAAATAGDAEKPVEYLTTIEVSTEARLHILIQERHIALQERGKAAKLCIEAKVEERGILQAERDGETFARYTEALLTGFGLKDDPRAPEIVRRAFTVIEGGKAA